MVSFRDSTEEDSSIFTFDDDDKKSKSFDDDDDEITTIRFKERNTIIGDKRRKTRYTVRQQVAEDYDDPELDEILSLGSLEIDPETCEIEPLMSMVMACIMDEATESLCIMSKTFGFPDLVVDMSHKTLHERNELLKSHSTIFNLETLEEYSKTENEYMMKKQHADIVFLQNILAKGVRTLITDNNYYLWLNFIDNYDLQLEQDERLLQMVERKTRVLEDLRNQLQFDKVSFREKNEELTLKIGKAKDDMEDFIIHSDIKNCFLGDWENSRQQQNLRVRRNYEQKYEKQISYNQSNIHKEMRVHHEIKNYVTEYFRDTEDAIQEWMTNYDRDMEQKDEDILKMGFTIEEMDKDLKDLQKKFDFRTQEMQDWLERKAEKKRQEEEYIKMNMMATKIQAWWRGVMFRKQLGPYRPKKKKGAKNKKNKK